MLRPSEILLETRSAHSKNFGCQTRLVSTIWYGDQVQACSRLSWLARKFWLSKLARSLKLRSVSTIGDGDQVQACLKLARLARKFWLSKLAHLLDSPLVGLNTSSKAQFFISIQCEKNTQMQMQYIHM